MMAQTTNILHSVSEAHREIQRFKARIQNKEVVVFHGNTRAGKSTLINFLQGNDLEVFKDSKRSYIRKTSEGHGPVIIHGSNSSPKLPSVWSVKPELAAVDMPGFDDTRGVYQDIVNTLFFNQLRNARSVRFVLVSDITDLDKDNIQSFTTAMEKMQSTLEDFNELKDAFAVVFTKDCKTYTKEDMTGLLRKKIMDVPELSVKKDLIYHVCKNSKLIGVFRMPQNEGRLNREEVDHNVEAAIYSTDPIIINTNDIKFSPSSKSHTTLLGVYQNLLADLDLNTEVCKAVKRYKEYFSVDQYVFASTEEELNDTKMRLQFILPRVTTEQARDLSNITILKISLSNISGTISDNVEKHLDFLIKMEECGLLDKNIKQLAVEKYKKNLSDLLAEINRVIKKIDDEAEERTKETVQYVVAEGVKDKGKLTLFGAAMVPIAKKALASIGISAPEAFTFEFVSLTGGACALAGAGTLGAVAGGGGVMYYKNIYKRQKLRRQQGRCC